MIVLWIVLAVLAAAFLVFEGYCLWASVFRHRQPDLATEEGFLRSEYAKYAEHILPGGAWIRSKEPEPWQVVSYDGKLLSGLFIAHENAKGTVVFFHGYRSSCFVDFAAGVQFYYNEGYNLLLCDQRAHGKSQGRVISYGVKERYDVVSWTTYLAMTFGEEHPIFLAGMSMGAATVLMASELEFCANIRGIVADCGFTGPWSILDHVMTRDYHIPGKIFLPVQNVFTRIFAGFSLKGASTVEALRHTALPVLLIHGTGDNFVPCRMSEENYAACAGEKKLLLVNGAGHAHSYLVDPLRYEDEVRTFLQEHLAPTCEAEKA